MHFELNREIKMLRKIVLLAGNREIKMHNKNPFFAKKLNRNDDFGF